MDQFDPLFTFMKDKFDILLVSGNVKLTALLKANQLEYFLSFNSGEPQKPNIQHLLCLSGLLNFTINLSS